MKLLGGLVLMLCCLPMQLQAQTYGATLSSAEWEVQTGDFACSLSQQVSGYGRAYFGQRSGSAGFFEFRDIKKSFPPGSVKIDAVPPSWRSDLTPNSLFSIASAAQLKLNATQAQEAAAALARGSNLVFTSSPHAETGASLRVHIHALRFGTNYSRYKECVANLIPHTFEQLSRTVINYAADSLSLSKASKAQLDKIVRYTKADHRVLGILVDAHSDERADAAEAEQLSKLQAELVTDYLIDKGIPASFITARWHGDKFPIANNKQKTGQAENRRVTLRLESEATRKERERRVAALKAAEEREAAKQAQKAASENAQPPQQPTLAPSMLEQMVEQQDLNRPQSAGSL